MVCKCRDFLEDASLHAGNCKSITTSKPLKCNCLKILDKSIAREAATLYMLRYMCLEGKQWFFVPFLNPYEEGGEHDFIDEDTPEKHTSTIVEDIVNFFDELKELGRPQSTRIISIYYQFCHDRGRTVKLKKNLNSVLEVTPVEPFEWDRKLICSWPYFLKYWDTNFPNNKIVSRSADVCSKCHVFRNHLRYVRYETTTEPGSDTTCCSTETSLKRYFLNKKKKVDVKEVLVERETRKVF
eukprot:jgi/Psemu1/56085/gm1.56085_g